MQTLWDSFLEDFPFVSKWNLVLTLELFWIYCSEPAVKFKECMESARQNATVAEQTPTNTGSPKLPPLEEVEKYISRTVENPLGDDELHIIGSTWAYIERQLRAGA